MDKQSLRSKSASRINSVVQDKRRLREDVLFFVLLSARTDLSQAAFASVCNGHAVTRFYLRVSDASSWTSSLLMQWMERKKFGYIIQCVSVRIH